MKHEKIFDALIELESQVENLQDFICKMEGDQDPKEDGVDSKWGEMSLERFLSGGATEMTTKIFNGIGNVNKRLRHIVNDEPTMEKAPS